MRGMTGAYILIGAQAPISIVLSATAYKLYLDRVRVVGFTKANAYTFGHEVTHALPCTVDCMEFSALNYEGPRRDEVRQICARVALGQPIGNGKDITEGGLPARLEPIKPLPSAPSGIAQRIPSPSRF